ncbi:MAG: hypothetical protein Q4E07_03600 [Eubacteriales bacterium]|nr:hypothetical protein [Eubacteriales bacterium]
MDHFEMVEKLRTKTQVSYEEAKAALEANDWDLLNALIYLESRGKASTAGEADYTTKQEFVKSPRRESGKYSSSGYASRVFSSFADLVHASNRTMFQLYYRKKLVIELPVTAMVLLVTLVFPTILFALIIAMFFGVRYKIHTEEGKGESVNRWLDKAADTMDNIKYGKNDEE